VRIVFLSNRYPPDKGGAETYAYELTNALTRRGHDIDVYTRQGAGQVPSTPEGVSVINLFPRQYLALPEAVFFNLVARMSVDLDRYDVVHGIMMPSTTLGLTLRRQTPTPVVVTSHGTLVDEALSHEARRLEDYVLKFGVHPGNAVLDYLSGRRADRVIAISEHTWERLTGTYGFDEDRVVTIPHGVDTERFRPFDATHPAVSDDRFTVLTVGRLGSRKGVEFAIRGIERVDEVDLEFLIAGEGRYEDRLRELVAERGLSDRVTFLGRVKEEELPLRYSSADVFCLTSMEGFGLVLLEAMACGTPVIATDVGGCRRWSPTAKSDT
jgi:glycosyltransferase involved in cell wall biosynthesis